MITCLCPLLWLMTCECWNLRTLTGLHETLVPGIRLYSAGSHASQMSAT